jgi:hypothetical protein
VSTELDAIHDDVRANPEDVWDRLARLLCASATGPAKDADFLARTDLIEDLMFFHADAFIDRLETLLQECPELRADVVMAHVGGVGVGPGLRRFYAIQDALSREFEASGELFVWNRDPDG